MPRGNDPDARREFLERYGTLNPDIPTTNAEELIRAHNASQSRAVAKASLLPQDNEATNELDLESLNDKAGGNVVAAAVRGNAIVCVVEDDNGRTFKTVVPANDKYVAPEESPDEIAAREQSAADMDLQNELMRQRRDFEEQLAEMRAEFEEKLGEVAAQKREEGAERVQKAVEEAQNDDGDDDETPTHQVSASDPGQGSGPKTQKSPGGKQTGRNATGE